MSAAPARVLLARLENAAERAAKVLARRAAGEETAYAVQRQIFYEAHALRLALRRLREGRGE